MNNEVTFPYSPDSERPLKSFKFKTDIDYIIGEQVFPVTESANKLTVECDFKNNLFPIVVLDLVLKREDMNRIIDNYDSVLFRINLERFPYDQSDGQEEAEFGEWYWRNLVLTPFEMPRQRPPESQEGGETDLNGGQTSNQFDFKVYLFSEELLNMNRNIHDFVFDNCEIKDVMLYLMNFHGARPNSLLMNMPDNRHIYDQVITPPYNLHNSLDYYQKYYGIYQFGMLFFMDFFTTYILSNDIINKTLTKPDEYNIFFIEFVDNQDATTDVQQPRYVDDWKNERYYLRMMDGVSVSDASTADREIFGDRIIALSRKANLDNTVNNWYSRDITTSFQNSKLNIDSIVANDNMNASDIFKNSDINIAVKNRDSASLAASKRNDKVKYLWDKTSNDFLLTEYLFNASKETRQVSFAISNLNLDHFTPNRLFRFKFSNEDKGKEYNGFYQLSKLVYSMDLGTAKFSTMSGVGIFDRLNEVNNNVVKSS